MITVPTSWLTCGAALGLLALFASVQTVRLARSQAAVARVELQSAQREADMQARLTAQVEANRAKEQDWNAQQQEAANVARLALDAARADARAAQSASDRLRQRATELARSCNATAGPAVPVVSPAASAPGDLLADMQRRIDEAAGEIGRYADELTIARQSCEAAWPR